MDRETYSCWSCRLYCLNEIFTLSYNRGCVIDLEIYIVFPPVDFDIYLFLVFLAGVLLFFFADILSRSDINIIQN